MDAFKVKSRERRGIIGRTNEKTMFKPTKREKFGSTGFVKTEEGQNKKTKAKVVLQNGTKRGQKAHTIRNRPKSKKSAIKF
mgnify:CR=1 FL=1